MFPSFLFSTLKYDYFNKNICGNDEIISNNMILQKSLKPVRLAIALT